MFYKNILKIVPLSKRKKPMKFVIDVEHIKRALARERKKARLLYM